MSDKTGYIFSNARIATLGENSEGLGLIDNAALAVKTARSLMSVRRIPCPLNMHPSRR